MTPKDPGRHRVVLPTLLLTLLLSPIPLPAQTISGVILDQRTGDPIEGVSVMLMDSDERPTTGVLSDEAGGFIMTAPWTGRFRVRCERIGYATATSAEIDLLPPDTVAVEMRLSVEAVELAPLTIISDREPLVIDTRMARWGYYERRVQFGLRGSGVAHFLDYETIKKRNPARVTDMFTTLSSVKVVPVGRRGISVRSTRSSLGSMGSRGCGLTFYLDGVRLILDRDESINDYVVPPHLAAIEVYVSAPYPIEYAPKMGDCGCVLIWTGFVEGRGIGDQCDAG